MSETATKANAELRSPAPAATTRWLATVELAAIGLFVLWFGRAYLDFSESSLPVDTDFALTLQGHTVWNLVRSCGLCFLWNGSINGGNPAFADYHGAPLHPVVIAATLLFGVVNGGKAIVLVSLAMAGAAQWWLARVMGLGRSARLWSAAMAVAGGHLAARMELGLVGIVLSTAACSLVLAPLVDLARSGGRRSAVMLGVILALAGLSAQGYLQFGLLLGVLPAALVLFVGKRRQWAIWKELLIAGALALLLCAVLLVPLLHFAPHAAKYIADFSKVQPMQYAPLNLVVSDRHFYGSAVLQNDLPALSMNYIGWVPVLLAFGALRLAPAGEGRLLAFFMTAILMVYVVVSATPFILVNVLIRDIVNTVRFPMLAAGLATPLILVLAAWSCDGLLSRFRSAEISRARPWYGAGLILCQATIVGLMLWGLYSTVQFNRPWLSLKQLSSDVAPTVEALKSGQARWVKLPDNDFDFVLVATDAGLKVTDAYRAWWWKDNPNPPFAISASRQALDLLSSSPPGAKIEISDRPHIAYAYVDAGTSSIPCSAQAAGGNIEVVCASRAPGTLVVAEHSWTGWSVWRDNLPSALVDGNFLSVAAPAGEHRYSFRYRPWDVAIGFALTLAGLALAVFLWRNATDPPP